jgi:hypothetical protein
MTNDHVTNRPSEPQLPPGATPIQMEEVFSIVGELYVQVRVQQRTIQRLSSGLQLEPTTT